MRTIVKVQIAIIPPDGPALIYPKNRRRMVTMELPPEVTKKMRGDLKGYFHATWTGETYLIHDRVKDQYW